MIICAAILVNLMSAQKYMICAKAATHQNNARKIVLSPGESCKLKIKNARQIIRWSSNKKSIATVLQSGKVKAKKKGRAVIVGKIGEAIYRYEVFVVSKKKAALSAYARILIQKKYNKQMKWKRYCFSICDLNGDHIPEMILYNEASIWGIIGYYSYSNGKTVKIKGISYPFFGMLYELPIRKSFAFYRGGPAVKNYMPYTLVEYKIRHNKIKGIHEFSMDEYTNGKKKCFCDGRPCKVKEYKRVEKSLKQIKILENSKKNRIKYGVDRLAIK